MRRGLIAWSKAELPPALFEMRLARTQRALATAGLDALALYTNHTRPSAASWLCGFIPYWSEGMLVVQRHGPTLLAVALSRRVQDWIERVAAAGEVISAPRFAFEAGRSIAETTPGAAIGVLELDDLPSRTADELQLADPGARLVDATALFDTLRAPSDAAEIALATRAADLAHAALAALPAGVTSDAAAVAAVDGEARRRGAEEVYVAIAPDLFADERFVRQQGPPGALGRAFAVRATVAYKGAWVRMVRPVVRDGALGDAVEEAAEALASAVTNLPGTEGFPSTTSWLIETTTRSQPLEPCAGSAVHARAGVLPPFAGTVVTAAMTVPLGGVTIPVAAPALAGAFGRPGALLVPPVFSAC